MKPTITDIPDTIRPYLNEIAERLWAERAAVMIGAGFSKNAGGQFPDWNQLGDIFYQKAHGVKPEPAKQTYLNPLQLAEEVQAAIGRPALENLLSSNIPDLSVEPSELHTELLELPWVDVFTTNYDTLLERASAKVVTRRYEPVVNKEDISYAIKPRIVKLHGSFPSERPFIITEEDYRRYPYENAPFVNTVQQALLENSFCLIGFSGDDPNFLKWIGWIRDNLGRDTTQKIYLVGVFDLSPARLQLLIQRGVIVVDLSCCYGVEKNDHKTALNLFLEYIRSKKPNAIDWPYHPKMMHPSQNDIKSEELQKITEEWRQQREAYPGWLILPDNNRESLWAYTSAWTNYLPDAESTLSGLDLQYSFELIWRLERCLLPIFSHIAELCEKLLIKYWPFETNSLPASIKVDPKEDNLQNINWGALREPWLAITISMLRFYREEGYLDKWVETESQLKALSGYLSSEQKEFLKYEGFLFSLFTLDLPTAKQRLEEWRSNDSQPYSMIKRAAGLAELGLINEAETVSKYALENIRKKLNQKADVADFTLVSLESNAMLLGEYIQDSATFEKGILEPSQSNKVQFNDRWNELRAFKCDPWNEIKLFELRLKNPPAQRKVLTEIREFDIGRVTRTRHLSSTDVERLSAYAFLRFCEEIGLPYRIGCSTMAKKTAISSLQQISKYSSFWAIATLFRLGDVAAINDLFSREYVYQFTTEEADQLTQSYLEVLNSSRDKIHTSSSLRNENYSLRLTKLLPEIISRLCCKCSNDMKKKIIDFIAGVYASPAKNNYSNINNLISRLIDSMSELEQYNFIPDFLKVSFPNDLNLKNKNEFINPLLLLGLKDRPEYAVSFEVKAETLESLYKQAILDSLDNRSWAIKSLITLYNLQLLNDEQSKKLGEAIWQFTDEQYSLPIITDYYNFVYLDLPHPKDINLHQLFKKYVRSQPFPVQSHKQNKNITMTGGRITIAHEIIGANAIEDNIWLEEDAIEILQRLIEWWDADKHMLKRKESSSIAFLSILQEFRARFSLVTQLLAKVVIPKLNVTISEDIKKSLIRVISEMRERELPTLEAEASSLHLFPLHKSEIYNRIQEALISREKSVEIDALQAVASLLLNTENNSAVEEIPVTLLSQFLSWSSIESINAVLWNLFRIIKSSDASSSLSSNLEVALKKRLDKLLNEVAYDSNNSELDFDEKLEVRRIASKVAAALWIYYSSRNLPIPLVIKKWREQCISASEFSEVRHVWEACQYSS